MPILQMECLRPGREGWPPAPRHRGMGVRTGFKPRVASCPPPPMLDPSLLRAALPRLRRTAPLPLRGSQPPQLLPGAGGALAGGHLLLEDQASCLAGFLVLTGSVTWAGGQYRLSPMAVCRLSLQKRDGSHMPPSSLVSCPPRPHVGRLGIAVPDPSAGVLGPSPKHRRGALEQTCVVSAWRPESRGRFPRKLCSASPARCQQAVSLGVCLWSRSPRTRTQSCCSWAPTRRTSHQPDQLQRPYSQVRATRRHAGGGLGWQRICGEPSPSAAPGFLRPTATACAAPSCPASPCPAAALLGRVSTMCLRGVCASPWATWCLAPLSW